MNRKQLTIEAELTLEELRFAEDLRGIVRSNLQKVYSAINFGQVNTNWNIGRRIVEEEQHGQTRAEYGKRVIAIASQALTEEFGKGYSQTNCKSYRKFYIEFQKFAMRLCQNAGTTFFYAQSPDFLKPGLCYYPKFM